MKKIIGSTLCLLIVILALIFSNYPQETLKINNLTGMIIAKNSNKITIRDEENIIYTFENYSVDANIGDTIILRYTGILNKNTENQQTEIFEYQVSATTTNEVNANDIFRKYYEVAQNKLNTLSLEEKIGQIFLVRYSEDALNIIEQYQPAGFVFYEKDFKDKTTSEVKQMINSIQSKTKIPLLTAVDEEGGKIVRISSNANLVSTPFKASSELYNEGGFNLIKEDTITKSRVLKNLGLNLNLAPVVDVATNENAYIYERTLGKNTLITSDYAKIVIAASKNMGVSYTLKHFPGYGNNSDTHIAQAIDTRSYDDIFANDLPPFKSGIDAGAEAILVSHNIVTSIDANNPASLSTSIHNLLRNELDFTGVIITDDLNMGATSSIVDKNIKAILAGNDLIITTDYEESVNEIKHAIKNNAISEKSIDNVVIRILAWKYYKGLFDIEK